MAPLRDELNPDRRPWAAVGAALAAAFALNVAMSPVRLRADFSRGGIYSVSASSLKILRGLREPLTAEVYASRDLPGPIATRRDYLLDLLEELRDGSGGNLRIVKVTVDTPESEERAERAGIASVRFDIVERDKFETRSGRLGARLLLGKRQQVLPFVSDASGLEYDLMSRVRQLVDAFRPGLGFASAGAALPAERLPDPVRRRIEERFDVRTVDLSAAAERGFSADLKVLALVGPSQALNDRELFALDRFLVGGGSLLLALDRKRVDLRSFTAVPQDVGLSSWTASKGVSLRDALVFDAQNQPVQVSVRQGSSDVLHLVQYPPFVAATDFAAHPATKTLSSIIFPFVSPVEAGPRGALRPTVLVRSSPYSWLSGDKSPFSVLSPFNLPSPAPDAARGPFALAVAVEGAFAPLFASPPKGLAVKGPPLVPAPGRLVVIGCSHFLDAGLSVPEANFSFLLNLADWLAADSDLIAIRSKSIAFQPLREISAPARALVRWLLILLPPGLAALAGLAAWHLREKRRERLEALYGVVPAAAES